MTTARRSKITDDEAQTAALVIVEQVGAKMPPLPSMDAAQRQAEHLALVYKAAIKELQSE